MKRITFLTFTLWMGSICPILAQNSSIKGKIISNQQPVEYANVTVNTADTTFIAGSVTDANGNFSLPNIPSGNYLLKVACMGYQTTYHPFKNSTSSTDLGKIPMKFTSITMNEVVVKAPMIKREADRFIVDVANSVAAIGKDGAELLQQAPGVWITDDKIAINGSSGAKVFVNERELRMSKEQLINYLRDLKSEDIQRIDVIPQAGAEYDANMSSGIIKISMKRQRNDGMTGNASFTTRYNDLLTQYYTSEDVRYHNNKLTLNAGLSLNWKPQDDMLIDESNLSTYNQYNAQSGMEEKARSLRAKLGAIYEFTPRHSVGLELEYAQNTSKIMSPSTSFFAWDESSRYTESLRRPNNRNKNFSATFNYIYILDPEGSTIKLLGDYNSNRDNNRTDGYTSIRLDNVDNDSTYYEHTRNNYQVSTLTLALEKHLSSQFSLKAGGKYTLNHTKSRAQYAYQEDIQWIPSEDYCFDIRYKENIAAVYGVLSAKLGRWGLTGGLRAEYTHTNGEGSYIKQSYISLFPNMNISYTADKKGKYMLIGQYSRSISRPNFWMLNPTRIQVSDYTFQTGNPNLLPSYNNKLSATLVFAQKYTLTFAAEFIKDNIQQYATNDPNKPNISNVNQANFNDMKQYVCSIQLPFDLTDWWNWQNNIVLARNGDKLTLDSPQNFHNMFIYNTNSTFTLPGKFYLDINYSYNGKVRMSNVTVSPNQRVTLKLKKKFLKEKLTATIGVKNLFIRQTDLHIKTDEYERLYNMKNAWQKPSFECKLSYSFQTGKSFKNKNIESGAEDERSRLGGKTE